MGKDPGKIIAIKKTSFDLCLDGWDGEPSCVKLFVAAYVALLVGTAHSTALQTTYNNQAVSDRLELSMTHICWRRRGHIFYNELKILS